MTLTHTLRLLSACSLLLTAGCSPLELESETESGAVQTGTSASNEPPEENGEEESSQPDSLIVRAISVAEAKRPERLGTEVVVVGYYIGFVSGKKLNEVIFAKSADAENNNMLLVDDYVGPDEDLCFPVALPENSLVRSELNTFSHPELHKRRIMVQGMVETYFGVNGIKDPKQWRVLNDDELLPNPEPEPNPEPNPNPDPKPNPNPDPNPGQTLPQINPSAAPCLRAL